MAERTDERIIQAGPFLIRIVASDEYLAFDSLSKMAGTSSGLNAGQIVGAELHIHSGLSGESDRTALCTGPLSLHNPHDCVILEWEHSTFSFVRSASAASLHLRRGLWGAERFILGAIKRMVSILAVFGGGLAMHCSAAAKNGTGYVFVGPSGAGKSTIASLLEKAGWTTLNDDFNVVYPHSGVFHVHATPFLSQKNSALQWHNGSGELLGAFFISHGTATEMRNMPIGDSFSRTLQAAFAIPASDLFCHAVFDSAHAFCVSVPTVGLSFSPDHGAVAAIENFTDNGRISSQLYKRATP